MKIMMIMILPVSGLKHVGLETMVLSVKIALHREYGSRSPCSGVFSCAMTNVGLQKNTRKVDEVSSDSDSGGKCKRARWWESRRLDELPEENDVDQWHAEETLEAEDDDYDDHWPADWQDDQDDQWHEEMLEADESRWLAQKDDRDSESTLSSRLSDWGPQ